MLIINQLIQFVTNAPPKTGCRKFRKKMETEIKPLQKTNLKTIYWETNYNNKMDCNSFIHIDFAPPVKPSRSQLSNTIIEIRTTDASHAPVQKQLYDLMFLPFQQIPDALCFASHGISAYKLVTLLFDKYAPRFNWTTEMCIWFYQPPINFLQ